MNKDYYNNMVLKKDFPNKLSYSKFIELNDQTSVPKPEKIFY